MYKQDEEKHNIISVGHNYVQTRRRKTFICLGLVYGGVQHILCYVLCFVCLRLVYGGVQHILCYVLCFICLRLVYGGVQHILCYVLCFICQHKI
jgi:hypothetical protein